MENIETPCKQEYECDGFVNIRGNTKGAEPPKYSVTHHFFIQSCGKKLEFILSRKEFTKECGMFEWNADSDSSNSMESWEEWDILKDMLEREKFQQGAVTAQWRRERFYQTQFPLVLIEKLFGNEFGQCSSEMVESRNFVFVLPNPKGGRQIVVQYQSFRSPVELQAAFCERPPLRVEIGSRGFEPASIMPVIVDKLSGRGDADPYAMHTKELVFDVDITEWNDLRVCQCIGNRNSDICRHCGRATSLESELVEEIGYCECVEVEAQVCSKCWCYAKASIMLMHFILTQRFGFKEVLFIFSGSKGYHCWVFDDEVKYMSLEQRTAIVNYFTPWTDKKRIGLKDESNDLLGDIEESFLEGVFADTILAGGIFSLLHPKSNWHLADLLEMDTHSEATKENFMALLDLALVERWTASLTWDNVKAFIFCHLPQYRAKAYVKRILYSYMFPRIDIPITSQIKHLIKLPYSLHQTTKLISTPILPYEFLSFDPSSCPNVTDQAAIDQSMQETEVEVDFMRNALNNIYYCPECHPPFSDEDLAVLAGRFESQEPGKYARIFLVWCARNISKFRLFRNLDTLCSHSRRLHGCETILCNTSTVAEWLRSLTVENGLYNIQQYELLVLAFLFLLVEKKFLITSLPESIARKIQGLNLTFG